MPKWSAYEGRRRQKLDKTVFDLQQQNKRILWKRLNCSPDLFWVLYNGGDGSGHSVRPYKGPGASRQSLKEW